MAAETTNDVQRTLLCEWLALVARRAADRREAAGPLAARIVELERQAQRESECLAARHADVVRQESLTLTQGLNRAEEAFERSSREAQSQHRAAARRAEEQFETTDRVWQRARDESRFEARALYEAKKADLAARTARFEAQAAAAEQALAARGDELRWLLGRVGRSPEALAEPEPACSPPGGVDEAARAADMALARLHGAAGLHDSGAWLAAAGALAAWLPLGWGVGALVGASSAASLYGLAGGGVVAGLAALFGVRYAARGRATRAGLDVARQLAAAAAALANGRQQALTAFQRERAAHKDEERQAYAQAEETYHRRRTEQDLRRVATLAELETESQRRLEAALAEREREVARAHALHEQRKAAAERRLEHDQRRAAESFASHVAAARQAQADFTSAAQERFAAGARKIVDAVDEFRGQCDASFPAWSELASDDWTPPRALPRGIRIGHWTVSPAETLRLFGAPAARRAWFESGEALPESSLEPADVADLPTLRFPLVLEWPLAASLSFAAPKSRGEQAVASLQAVILRLLASAPPGRARFTLMDPLALGRSFAAFMHLADYEETLVGKRIWTESPDIESKLASLAEHVELVTQQYLRNEFATLEDYNEQAGEVVEPYRYLVVAHLPTHFTESAARRLARLLAGGPRCGVYTLLALDLDEPLPPGIRREEIVHPGGTVRWTDAGWRWASDGWEHVPLELDVPPEERLLTRLLRQIGQAAVGADRVVVPFAASAPDEADWWTADSSAGLRVPLGPSGANKLQYLDLGRGTAQHALVVGKTGSGKSTLLHALITGASLWYGPDQVELYLIDFKKGVEFKPYAARGLPQARIVAIESDREFGLSVLEKLDAELRRRGERFRAAGVQDLAGYRATTDAAVDPMPRTLLIVDEFQEFFVADDKLAHDAALLLDRLVRQGRAFGLHVVLGSQTLGGAYSLARATLGQMAVRIVLPCSEADGHLALGEENTAARHLARPGQAIYNEAGGAVDANRSFQVSWLDESSREDYLRKLAERKLPAPERRDPAIVFEGNTPGDLAANAFLAGEVALPPGHRGSELALWLGEPVSIKAPTQAVLRRQSGHHLLVVGQRDDLARSLSAAALVSLAAQQAAPAGAAADGAGPRVMLLEGSPPPVERGESLADVARAIGLPLVMGGPREAALRLGQLTDELVRRQSSGVDAAPWLAIVHDLQRFRELRRRDDDFGFNARGEAATPLEQLARLLREGPLVGLHFLVWCDNWNNLQRSFDRALLREFDQRVLFQMSPNDSSCLIDAPAAHALGPHRALFHDDELGVLEKFRPYAWPGAAWLAALAGQIAARPAPSWRT